MITFRPMNLETDAADMARIYSHTTVEPIPKRPPAIGGVRARMSSV